MPQSHGISIDHKAVNQVKTHAEGQHLGIVSRSWASQTRDPRSSIP